MTLGKTYHHGDLRQALLTAAEVELGETGIEGFSLRKVAQRAGVSHAAPAHHFRNTRSLLTALAAVGYRRFVEAQQARQREAAPDAESQLAAAGLGYIDFAKRETALFRLIFGSNQLDFDDPVLAEASRTAFDHLVSGVEAITGTFPLVDPEAMIDVSATWAIAHGLADLSSSGRLPMLDALPRERRDQVMAGIIQRVFRAAKPVTTDEG